MPTTMHYQRRSGRIAKELPIVLLGTDTAGKVFAEETKTVVLSRHGAGVVSRYKFAPDEVLTLRLPDSSREAEVRLVGHLGGEAGRYVYGLAFVDATLEFWPMDFPPPESFETGAHRVTLQCSFCQAHQSVEQGAIEEDVYSVNGNVLRFCQNCGLSTPWTKALGPPSPAVPAPPSTPLAPVNLIPPVNIASVPPPPSAAGPIAPLPMLTRPEPREPLREPPPPPPVPPASAYSRTLEPALEIDFSASAYSNAALETVPTAAAQIAVAEIPTATSDSRQPQPAPPPSPQTSERPVDANGRRVNRRKHTRVRVNFRACVRRDTFEDEEVECENISKGGICFHSRKHYGVDSEIEIAAPFSPGEPALFVAARIRRFERIGQSDVFRYGAAYLPAQSK